MRARHSAHTARRLGLALGLASIICPITAARAAEPAPADPAYARVSFLEGELFLKSPFDEKEAPVSINTIVREGDVLRAAPSTRAEIELPGASFLRLSGDTSLVVDGLEGQVKVTLKGGAVYLSEGKQAPDIAPDITVQTGLGGLSATPGTLARVDLVAGAEETMATKVAGGRATVTCRDAKSELGGGALLSCSLSRVERGAFDPKRGDDFDQWSLAREERVRHYQVPESVASGQYEGLQDLEGQGEWVSLDGRWYWKPNVEDDWRPYSDGYWWWGGPWGWTWISYSPWGHVTHHYGRWVWMPRYGWVWAIYPGFGGAWVAWSTFDGYLGWAPCDFWGRPVFVVSAYSYYDPFAWSFARPGYFWGGGGDWRHGRGWDHDGDRDRGRGHDRGHDRDHGREPPRRPFFTVSREDFRRARPSAIQDPFKLRPHFAEGSARGTVSGFRDRVGIQESPRSSGTEPSMLTHLLDQDRARTVHLHDKALDRPPAHVSPRGDVGSRSDEGRTIRIDRPSARFAPRGEVGEEPRVEQGVERVEPRGFRSDGDAHRPVVLEPRGDEPRTSEPRPGEERSREQPRARDEADRVPVLVPREPVQPTRQSAQPTQPAQPTETGRPGEQLRGVEPFRSGEPSRPTRPMWPSRPSDAGQPSRSQPVVQPQRPSQPVVQPQRSSQPVVQPRSQPVVQPRSQPMVQPSRPVQSAPGTSRGGGGGGGHKK